MKKACNHSLPAFPLGYRQVTFYTTSTEWLTPIGREPSDCLFSCNECLAVFKGKRTRAKSSISICSFQVFENGDASSVVNCFAAGGDVSSQLVGSPSSSGRLT